MNVATTGTFGLDLSAIRQVGSQELFELSCGGPTRKRKRIVLRCPVNGTNYDGPLRNIDEGEVVRAMHDTIAFNFTDVTCRKRQAGATMVCQADELPSNKDYVGQRFNLDFEQTRRDAFSLLARKKLATVAYEAGAPGHTIKVLAVCDQEHAFLAYHGSLLQRIVEPEDVGPEWQPDAIIYVVPEFRHSHFDGKQAVVHRRKDGVHEMWSFNLYPGPSFKKGIYGFLLERRMVAHCSVSVVTTPYRNTLVFRHMGASGGGKSEMGMATPLKDGRLMLGTDQVTGETHFVNLPDPCAVRVAADDMFDTWLSPSNRLVGRDAEWGHFLRLDGLREYGDDPRVERIMFHPNGGRLGTININALPGAQVLPWDHVYDVAPTAENPSGVRCANPRVMVPTSLIYDYFKEEVAIDINSFGVRCPLTTQDKPNYGIVGLVQVVHPLLYWIWELVAPRGSANPSIVGADGLESEGVGAYREFLIGDDIDHAAQLLEHKLQARQSHWLLIPNQHIGQVKVGFAPQWCCREYFSRRHQRFPTGRELVAAPCGLLGYSLNEMIVENSQVPRSLLQPWQMLGRDAYEQGASILWDFFEGELQRILASGRLPAKGKQIIEYTLERQPTWAGYEQFMR
ncbi:MAG: DUF4914 family protein [Bdellovibrionales bacterium]|nr:DUF4914 family protein [Bdellovibrionales bacterium]